MTLGQALIQVQAIGEQKKNYKGPAIKNENIHFFRRPLSSKGGCWGQGLNGTAIKKITFFAASHTEIQYKLDYLDVKHQPTLFAV